MFFTSTRSGWIKSLYFIILIEMPAIALGQIVQNGRAEFPIRSDKESYSVISLDTSGIILYRNFLGDKVNQLELTRLDSTLHQVWAGALPVPKEFSITRALFSDGKIYFFFKASYPGNQEFRVFVVDCKDGRYYTYPIKNVILFNATEFIVNKDAVLIAGYFNYRPIILHYSLKGGQSRVLPGFLNEPGEITQIKTYPNGDVDVIVSAKNYNRKKCLWIRHFDNAGDLIKTVVLEPEENKNLIFGRAVMSNDHQVIAGVYGRNSSYSRGIFVAEVNSYGEYAIRYYNFADLKNFFHYMKAKREKRIKDRIERRRIKGKKIKFNYRFLVHELVPYGNQFVMLGEAFYPTYSNQSSYLGTPIPGSSSPWNYGMVSRSFYTSPYRSDYIFDGFQYTHAVVIGFDTQAKLVWDNSFEINGIKSFHLEQFVKIVPRENKIDLVYLYENFIRSKIIKDDQVIEGTLQDPITTFDITKRARVESSKIEYWYHNHLFVSGVQNLYSADAFRKVFFINKLTAK